MPYDPNTAPVRQSDSWSCSVASAAWMLHSLGIAQDYHALEQLEMAAGLVSPADGLEDGSGGPLADWLAAQYGLTTGHQLPVSWDWLLTHAGTRPIAIGSGSLYHWVAVRDVAGESLMLSNPAPNYRGLGDTMSYEQFAQWAPWACVWLAVPADDGPEDEDVTKIDDLTNLLGLIQGDWADAVEQAINDAKGERNKAKRDADLDAALAALNTIRNGG